MSKNWLEMLNAKEWNELLDTNESQDANDRNDLNVSNDTNVLNIDLEEAKDDIKDAHFAKNVWQATQEERMICRNNKVTLDEKKFVPVQVANNYFYQLNSNFQNWNLSYNPFRKFDNVYCEHMGKANFGDNTFVINDIKGLNVLLQNVAHAMVDGMSFTYLKFLIIENLYIYLIGKRYIF